MILSNIQGRGLLKGVLSKGGGGGGVTDYNQLSSKPQINGITVEENHDGGYYGLIDSADIEVTEIYEIGYGSNYDINLNGSTVHVTNKIFHGATNNSNGSKGLVPAPAAGSVGKILSNEGWIDPPSSIVNYSTSEQKTGQKWIDGKDIYFRTFVVDNPTYDTTIVNWDTTGLNFIDIEGVAERSDGAYFPLNFSPSTSNRANVYIGTPYNGIYLEASISYGTITKVSIVTYYTKS